MVDSAKHLVDRCHPRLNLGTGESVRATRDLIEELVNPYRNGVNIEGIKPIGNDRVRSSPVRLTQNRG